MKALNFKHQTVVFAEDQPGYLPLPALKLEGKEGYVIFCRGLTFWERLRVLFLGKIWVSLMTFNKPLTPSFLSTNRKDCYSHPDDKTSVISELIKKFKINYN
ncbi:MAG: hypothetical protein V3V72_13565 [Ignavibacteriaceae bacterium]